MIRAVAPLQPDDPHTVGPYRLYERLGCGGMGRVFLGLSADALPIAVKVIRAELAADREFRARFRQEVAAVQKVSGTFTALVVDADLDGPVLWLATAYVAGPSLAEVVNSQGPLPVKQVLWLAAGLAEGLTAIHAAGVVHCDLKPSNVLLAEDGPRVIDFGISRSSWASAMPGADFGSPGFCSPEHVLGHVIGPPSDIFSLGAVLTFAATGQGPFGSGSSAALLWRLVNSSPRLDTLPAKLRGLVGSCLAKHPDERPTASELLTQVGPIHRQSGWLPQASRIGPSAVEPEPGRAGRDRFLRRMPVFVPGLLAALAATIFVLSGGLAPSTATLAQPPTGTAATPPGAQAQAQGADPATTPVPASSTQGGSRHRGQDRIGPSAYLSPFTPAVVTPALSPSGSPSPSQSPSPSPSPSSSGSASPSPSPSPSSSGSASPSPSPSSSGSASPSPSSPPSPSSSPSPSASPSSSSSSPSSPSPSPSSPSPSSSSSSPSAPAT